MQQRVTGWSQTWATTVRTHVTSVSAKDGWHNALFSLLLGLDIELFYSSPSILWHFGHSEMGNMVKLFSYLFFQTVSVNGTFLLSQALFWHFCRPSLSGGAVLEGISFTLAKQRPQTLCRLPCLESAVKCPVSQRQTCWEDKLLGGLSLTRPATKMPGLSLCILVRAW